MRRILTALAVVLGLCSGAADGGFGVTVPPPGPTDPFTQDYSDCIEEILAEPTPPEDPCIPDLLARLGRASVAGGKVCIATPEEFRDAIQSRSSGTLNEHTLERESQNAAVTLPDGTIVLNLDSFINACLDTSLTYEGKLWWKKSLLTEKLFHVVQLWRVIFRRILHPEETSGDAPTQAAIDVGGASYLELEGTAVAAEELLNQLAGELAEGEPDQDKIDAIWKTLTEKLAGELEDWGAHDALCLLIEILPLKHGSNPATDAALEKWNLCKRKFDSIVGIVDLLSLAHAFGIPLR